MQNIERAQKHPVDSYEQKVKLAEIMKIMTDKLPPEKGTGIRAWMRMSTLFNPKTQVRNVLRNAVIVPVNIVSGFVSSIADKALSRLTGVRTTGNTNIVNYTKVFRKGIYKSYKFKYILCFCLTGHYKSKGAYVKKYLNTSYVLV